MKHHLNLIFIFFTTLTISKGQGIPEIEEREDFVIGETLTINSTLLQESRALNIYLPLSYTRDSLKNYPVIFLLDGSEDEDFIHIAGLVQFGSFSWINMLPESIVVGIGNIDRQRDFTYPTGNQSEKKDFPTSGGSEKFIRFIANELVPLIDSVYRTENQKTIIGQSLGGLLTTEILFKYPELFDNYIIVSPSLWWDDENLLSYKPKDFRTKKSIYIAVGNEGAVMERTARELYEKLRLNNKGNSALFFEFLDDKSHGDALHMATYHAFEKIFKSEK